MGCVDHAFVIASRAGKGNSFVLMVFRFRFRLLSVQRKDECRNTKRTGNIENCQIKASARQLGRLAPVAGTGRELSTRVGLGGVLEQATQTG